MTLSNLNAFLPTLSIVLSIFIVIGGYVGFRSGLFKQSSEIQDQTISALKVRMDTLEKQAESDAKEIARLRQRIETIQHALKRRGLHIEIDGEYVTIIDADGQRSSTRPPPSKGTVMRPMKISIEAEDSADTGEAS